MLTKTLNTMIQQKQTTAREIAEMAGVSASTVYRWIAGQSQPDFDSIRLLVRHLPNRDAQQALLQVFTMGTTWQFACPDMELDVNADGKIDAGDALDASIEAVHSSVKNLKKLRQAFRDTKADADEVLELIHLLQHTASQCLITQQVLVLLCEQQKRRKLKIAR
jgi:transcriptional regulator with XRE-family HTH domain